MILLAQFDARTLNFVMAFMKSVAVQLLATALSVAFFILWHDRESKTRTHGGENPIESVLLGVRRTRAALSQEVPTYRRTL
jgi:hypothetical protein